jgi:hypothetical protein
MIKHHHLNKYFNLIQENSLFKVSIIFLESKIHAEDGFSDGGFISKGESVYPNLPTIRQALLPGDRR